MSRKLEWPKPEGASKVTWTGHGFEIDGKLEGVLSFLVTESGWSDELTALHEGAAGADHPIDLASRARALREVVHHKHDVVLEVGCSSGYMLRDLRQALPAGSLLIGADYVIGPLKALSQSEPSIPLLRFDLTRCPLPDESVDAVVALNVLEHIEDDEKAAREIARILVPGGAAIIELPAGPRLYDVHDKALLHFRRYTEKTAKALIEQAGLRVESASHIGFFVFPAFAAVKLRNKRHLGKSPDEQKRIVADSIRATSSSRAMSAAMGIESWLAARHVPFPWGIRCVLTAVKPR